MSRPVISFLQAQSLPWQPSPWAHLAGCQIKGLSRDPTTGARSLLVRCPIGWRGPVVALSTDEELLVIEGALEVDGRRLERDAYHAAAPGVARDVRAGPRGAVALVFWSSEPLWSSAAIAPDAGASRDRDAVELPWTPLAPDATPFGPDARAKILRGALEEPRATVLLSVPPHLHPPRWAGPQAVLHGAEERFVLAGDLLSPVGQEGAGAYSWHPPGSAQGPFGSRGGALLLLRSAEGPYRWSRSSHEMTLEREPGYQPSLPPELERLVAHPWRMPAF